MKPLTIVFVNDTKGRSNKAKKSNDSEFSVMHDLSELYPYSRYGASCVFDCLYVLKTLEDLEGMHGSEDAWSDLNYIIETGRLPGVKITKQLLKIFASILLRPEYRLIFVDMFFINSLTINPWIAFYRMLNVKFLYLEIAEFPDRQTTSLMKKHNIPVEKVTDTQNLIRDSFRALSPLISLPSGTG